MAVRGINKVILVGRLGKDPEVRYIPNGGAVANLQVATSESWRDKQTGEMRTGTLGLPASGLFTRFIVTYVSIRTSDTSSIPHSTPSQAYRTLPYPTTFASPVIPYLDVRLYQMGV